MMTAAGMFQFADCAEPPPGRTAQGYPAGLTADHRQSAAVMMLFLQWALGHVAPNAAQAVGDDYNAAMALWASNV